MKEKIKHTEAEKKLLILIEKRAGKDVRILTEIALLNAILRAREADLGAVKEMLKAMIDE